MAWQWWWWYHKYITHTACSNSIPITRTFIFIHTDRILTSEGRSGKALGSAAAVCQIICRVSSSILIPLQTWDISSKINALTVSVSLFLHARSWARSSGPSWRWCARACRCRRTTTEAAWSCRPRPPCWAGWRPPPRGGRSTWRRSLIVSRVFKKHATLV